jgi:hypothetical protein
MISKHTNHTLANKFPLISSSVKKHMLSPSMKKFILSASRWTIITCRLLAAWYKGSLADDADITERLERAGWSRRSNSQKFHVKIMKTPEQGTKTSWPAPVRHSISWLAYDTTKIAYRNWFRHNLRFEAETVFRFYTERTKLHKATHKRWFCTCTRCECNYHASDSMIMCKSTRPTSRVSRSSLLQTTAKLVEKWIPAEGNEAWSEASLACNKIPCKDFNYSLAA